MSVHYTPAYEADAVYPMTHARLLWEDAGFVVTGEAPALTNLIIRSQEFDNASWVKTEMTVTANALTAPDGTLTADKLIPSVVSADHRTRQTFAGITSGLTYTCSCFFKASGYGWARISLGLTFASNYVLVNLATGAVGLNTGVSGIVVTDAGDGWWRLAFTLVANATGSAVIDVYAMSANSFTLFAGDGVSGVGAWGTQLVLGAAAGGYIPTTTAAAAAAVVATGMDRISIPDTSTWGALAGSGERIFRFDFTAAKVVDGLGIAGHNLGGQPLIIEGATSGINSGWVQLAALTPANDSTLMVLFDRLSLFGVRVRVSTFKVSTPSKISSAYIGQALEMPVPGYSNLGPVDLNLEVGMTTYRTETGQLAGRFVQYEGLKGSMMFSDLREDWVRTTLMPVLRKMVTKPFFLACRPSGYPDDCSYAWTMKNIVPERMGRKNYMRIQAEVNAHVPSSLF